jgi:hypothetical protein
VKTPIQFLLNGEEVATFVESGANLLDTLREAVGVGRAPAAPAPYWSTARRGCPV